MTWAGSMSVPKKDKGADALDSACACLNKPDSISDHELIPSRLLRVSMFTIKNYAARVLIPMSDVYVCDVFIRVKYFECTSIVDPGAFRTSSGVFPQSFPSF